MIDFAYYWLLFAYIILRNGPIWNINNNNTNLQNNIHETLPIDWWKIIQYNTIQNIQKFQNLYILNYIKYIVSYNSANFQNKKNIESISKTI